MADREIRLILEVKDGETRLRDSSSGQFPFLYPGETVDITGALLKDGQVWTPSGASVQVSVKEADNPEYVDYFTPKTTAVSSQVSDINAYKARAWEHWKVSLSSADTNPFLTDRTNWLLVTVTDGSEVTKWKVELGTPAPGDAGWGGASSYTSAFFEKLENKGAQGGYAPLDGAGQVPIGLLPVNNDLSYQGVYDATLNVPDIGAAAKTSGDYWIVSSPGTQHGNPYNVGDAAIWDGAAFGQVLGYRARETLVADDDADRGTVAPTFGTDGQLIYQRDTGELHAVKSATPGDNAPVKAGAVSAGLYASADEGEQGTSPTKVGSPASARALVSAYAGLQGRGLRLADPDKAPPRPEPWDDDTVSLARVFGDRLQVHFRPDLSTGVSAGSTEVRTSDGALVRAIDLSGNGNHGTANGTPQLDISAKQWTFAPASDEWIDVDRKSGWLPEHDDGYECCIGGVVQFDSAAGSEERVFTLGTTSTGLILLRRATNGDAQLIVTTRVGFNDITTVAGGFVTDNVPYTFLCYLNGRALELYIDGEMTDTGGAGLTLDENLKETSTLRIGAKQDGTAELSGQIFEFFWVRGVVPRDERGWLHGYLREQHGGLANFALKDSFPNSVVYQDETNRGSSFTVPDLHLPVGRHAVMVVYQYQNGINDEGKNFTATHGADTDSKAVNRFNLAQGNLYGDFASDGVIIEKGTAESQDLVLTFAAGQMQGLLVMAADPAAGIVEKQGAALYCWPNAVRHPGGLLYRLHAEIFSGDIWISNGKHDPVKVFDGNALDLNQQYHINAALVVMADGKLMCAYCGHRRDTLLLRTITSDLNTLSTTREIATAGDNITYLHLLKEKTAAETLHIFSRANGHAFAGRFHVRDHLDLTGSAPTVDYDQLSGSVARLHYPLAFRTFVNPDDPAQRLIFCAFFLIQNTTNEGVAAFILNPDGNAGKGTIFRLDGTPCEQNADYGTPATPRFNDTAVLNLTGTSDGYMTLLASPGNQQYPAAQQPGALFRVTDWDPAAPKGGVWFPFAVYNSATEIDWVGGQLKSCQFIETTQKINELVLPGEESPGLWVPGSVVQTDEHGNGVMCRAVERSTRVGRADYKHEVPDQYWNRGGPEAIFYGVSNPFGPGGGEVFELDATGPISKHPVPVAAAVASEVPGEAGFDLQVPCNLLHPTQRQVRRVAYRI